MKTLLKKGRFGLFVSFTLLLFLGILIHNSLVTPLLADSASCQSESCSCSCWGGDCTCTADNGICSCICVAGDKDTCGKDKDFRPPVG